MRKIFPCLAGMAFLLVFTGCSTQKKIAREAGRDILDNPDFKSAHIGITLYDPATGQYIYDHQGDKFFVPASNTKLLTCYAAMKNLGDSLVGIRYVDKGNGTVEIEPNGDASFLHPDFPNQPVLDFLKKKTRVLVTDENWRENALGFGWAWDDYNSDYMAERSAMPVYGNVIRFTQAGTLKHCQPIFKIISQKRSVMQQATSVSGAIWGRTLSLPAMPAQNSTPLISRCTPARIAS
jgi:D-alanyl-D-alanine carboxypeptidase/D-alanyl-D-alanine-endopeptidase (penicillin-binding protein 4)